MLTRKRLGAHRPPLSYHYFIVLRTFGTNSILFFRVFSSNLQGKKISIIFVPFLEETQRLSDFGRSFSPCASSYFSHKRKDVVIIANLLISIIRNSFFKKNIEIIFNGNRIKFSTMFYVFIKKNYYFLNFIIFP